MVLKKRYLAGVCACNMKTDLAFLLASKLIRDPKLEYLGLTLKNSNLECLNYLPKHYHRVHAMFYNIIKIF